MDRLGSQKSKVKSQRLLKEELKTITENLKWFSRFSPSQKIRIIERHKRDIQYLISLKVKCR